MFNPRIVKSTQFAEDLNFAVSRFKTLGFDCFLRFYYYDLLSNKVPNAAKYFDFTPSLD